eukprot:TRINITY_DN18114_c0_g1_i1.p1 TRINITY_DN18114_c0_g1~~TRINITY_DN18114_c0_g1_i1.p1  ORF type:complete len:114 (+),score=28.37 TRINITY_DN18114_c0_g1_i1:79-420(+)
MGPKQTNLEQLERPSSSTSEIKMEEERKEVKPIRMAPKLTLKKQENNFMKEQPQQPNINVDDIAKDWGFIKEDTKRALQLKMDRELARKQAKKKKELSATERYQQFLKMSQKK